MILEIIDNQIQTEHQYYFALSYICINSMRCLKQESTERHVNHCWSLSTFEMPQQSNEWRYFSVILFLVALQASSLMLSHCQGQKRWLLKEILHKRDIRRTIPSGFRSHIYILYIYTYKLYVYMYMHQFIVQGWYRMKIVYTYMYILYKYI